MNLFLTSITKELIVQHDILPSDCFVELELDLINLVPGLHMDEKVGVVEDCIDQKIGAVFNVVDTAS